MEVNDPTDIQNESLDRHHDGVDSDGDSAGYDYSASGEGNYQAVVDENPTGEVSSQSLIAHFKSDWKCQSKTRLLKIDVTSAENMSTQPTEPIVQDTSMWPSLRGTMVVENGISKCRGKWGMTDAAHDVAGQTSPFEFSLVKALQEGSSFPVDGKYAGWFMLKQTAKSSVKIDDKELNIKFVKDESGHVYNITGDGVNKFGHFNLAGKLQISDNSVQMFRVYVPKKIPGSTPRKAGGRPAPINVAPSPRESSSRVRKPSAVLQAATEIVQQVAEKKPTPTPTAATKVPAAKRAPAPIVAETVTTGRTPRPPAFVTKCRDITRELSKQHLSIYFNEPVDAIKLGIPDYLDIIKEPMDFGTISKNLENNVYQSHEEFAEHMRLVFKNAITYNVRRDNPVHIAAREMSDMFEERYRMMVSQLGAYSLGADVDLGLLRGGGPKKGKSAPGVKTGRGGRPSTGGPRVESAAPSLDSSMQTMLMMQQRMQQMEAEINSLRTAVRQSDIRVSLSQQAVAAQAPLSYEEKKVLISSIMKLDGEQMTGVVDIIQSAMPSAACGDGDEVEIPVDELDTYTLRTLQEYVQSQLSAKAKKRPPAASPASKERYPTSSAPKRQRTSSAASAPRDIPVLQHQLAAPEVAASPPVYTPPVPPAALPDEAEFSFDMDIPSPIHHQPGPVDDLPTPGSGRTRSNSLDLFPDSMEEETEPNETPDPSGVWREESLQRPASREAAGVGASWGDAIAERNAEISRQSSQEANDKFVQEQRLALESQRMLAIERAREEEISYTSARDGAEAERLRNLREAEKASREGMQATVDLDQAQFALYDHEAFGL